MKKILAVILAALMLLTLVGCSSVENAISGVLDGGVNPDSPKDPEEVYKELDRLMAGPGNISNSTFGRDIEFTAILLTEPYEVDFDEEDGGPEMYQPAAISRNDEDYMMINIEKLTETFAEGEIVKVKGSIQGTIYSTVDNEMVEVMDFVADSMVAHPLSEKTPDDSPVVNITNGDYNATITFKDAYLVEGTFAKVVMVYFDHENKTDQEYPPNLKNLIFTQGGMTLAKSSFGVDTENLRSTALSASDIMPEKTKPMKTFEYYVSYGPENNTEDAFLEDLVIYEYDDDFNLVRMITIPVSADGEVTA